MKTFKVLLTLITLFSLSLVVYFVMAPPSYAQSEQTMVAVTPYKADEMLDFFFLNSLHSLTYIDDQATPVFVSIITPAQKAAYEKAGYKPVIVDRKAGKIDQYYILYGQRYRNQNQAASLQDPSYKSQGLELAYQLAPYSTLIKLSEGAYLAKLDIPALHDAKARRLYRDIVPNADITSQDLSNKLAQAKAAPAQTQADEKKAIPFGMIMSVLIILAVIAYFFTKNRSRKETAH